MRSADVRLGLHGVPGIGKTTVVEKLVDRLRGSGVPVGGFVTKEVRERQRVGFTCHDLAGGHALIAHVGWVAGPRVGRYRVNIAAFESIVLPALDRAAASEQIVIIDELGAMELCSEPFVRHVCWLLDQRMPIVLTMHSRPHPVTDALRARSDMLVLEVTRENRQGLADRLHRQLLCAMPDRTR